MKKKFLIIFGIIFLIGISALLYAYLETRWLKTKRIEIKSEQIPEKFNQKKIIFISDIHHGPFFSEKRVEKLVKRINKLEPDFIILGGDYVHREAKYIEPLFNRFAKFEAKNGVFAVLGNHDHWENAILTRKLMHENGINICDNKSYWVKIGTDSIKIGGVGDLWEDTQILDSTTFDLRESDFSILISHSPDFVEQIDNNLIDLTLCGHTHGGQVTFFGVYAPIVPSRFGQKYRYGLKKLEKTTVYITSGIGTITPPVRFFCRPEIVEITLLQ